MAELKYKTRGKSTPQGKQRVYFSYHPDDFSKYFDMVSKDILDKQNCAIWYDEEPDRPWDEELALDLERMQLFVMPVTAKLLGTDNRAIKHELPFALEHHIPVLPILMDTALEKEFNTVFGNVQWLNPFDQDETAISYEKKLEKFLDGVLIGDELAEKIRGEFDAYIFFSYRKKDRKYAADVMKKIHDKDACRDIAIWYDEYLVPGENFDENIKAALTKSDIFLMMVTPNLVNEKNYVMDHEYPEARRQEESILSVEVEAADKENYYKNFPGVPDTIDVEDEIAMNEAMKALRHENSIQKHEDTPEHIYYMGLAYLGGIDVEVDHKRAIKLLTEAAEAGYLEAMKKLANMYENGEAVERSYRISVIWRQKIVALMKQKYQDSKDYEDGLWLIEEMRFLSQLLEKEIVDPESAKQILLDAAEIAKELDSELGKWSLAAIYMDLTHFSYKNTDEKRELYLKALELVKKLQGDSCEYNHRGTLATCYTGLGRVHEKKKQYADALDYYLHALKIYEENVLQSETTTTCRELAIGYLDMVHCLMKVDEFSRATEYMEKGYEIVENLADESDDVKDQILHSLYLMAYADLCEKDTPLRAEQYLKEAEVLTEELMKKENSMEAKNAYARVCLTLSEFYWRNGDREKYLLYAKKQLEIFGEAISYNSDIDQELEQAVEYMKQALANEQEGDEEDADWFYERMTELLNKTDGSPKYAWHYYNIGLNVYNHGHTFASANNLSRAKKYFVRALWLAKKVIEIERKEDYLDFLANCYKAVAVISWNLNEMSDAVSHFEESAKIWDELYIQSGKQEYQLAWKEVSEHAGKGYSRLARIELNKGCLKEALQCYEKSVEILVAADASPDEIAFACWEAATSSWGLMDYEKGYKYFEQASDLFMKIATEQVIVQQGLTSELKLLCLKQMVLCDRQTAEYYAMKNDYRMAIAMLKSVEDIAFFIANATQREADYSELWDLLRQIYKTMEEAGDVEGAKEYKQLADRIYDMIWGTS